MLLNKIILCVFVCLLYILSPVSAVRKRKAYGEWSHVDYRDLNDEWEDGDDDDLLTPEWEAEKKIDQRYMKNIFKGDIGGDNMENWVKDNQFGLNELQKMGGTGQYGHDGRPQQAMMFIDLVEDKGGFKKYDAEALASVWRQKLLTGNLHAQIHNINNNKLIGIIDRPKFAKPTVDFLVEQPEVKQVVWNGQTYTKPEEDEDL